MDWVPVAGRVVHTIGWYKDRYGEENALSVMLREQVAPERVFIVEPEEHVDVCESVETPAHTPQRRRRNVKTSCSPQTNSVCRRVQPTADIRWQKVFGDLVVDYSRHGVSESEWNACSVDAVFDAFPLPATFRVAY